MNFKERNIIRLFALAIILPIIFWGVVGAIALHFIFKFW